jgi:hypothetical protein
MARERNNRVPLLSGAYQARSIISSGQRCVNLYPEVNPDPQAPVPVTHYPSPGLKVFGQGPVVAGSRGVYTASNGDLYEVVGRVVYYVSPSAEFTQIGIVADKTTPVSFADNGLVVVIVDGTTTGYAIDMAARTLDAIKDPNFLGADRVAYIDTYFAFNKPGTQQFYISLSLVSYLMLTTPVAGSAFDSLDIAAKVGAADNIVALISVHSQLWLIGALSSEIWYNSGAADFTFERQPGAFIEHGCVAPYSLAKQDIAVFWLSQDREGHGIVIKGSGYDVARISTHAIEADIQAYSRIDDAIGYCFQQQGHAFYVLTFPTADRTWAYELTTGQWHELAWTDRNGTLHRHRANCCCFAYGRNIIGDWQNGALFVLDPNTFTDAGNPIVRIRTLPHMINNGNRVTYDRIVIDMQTGTMGSNEVNQWIDEDFSPDFSFDFGPIERGPFSQISLRWSDDRGATFGNAITQDIGNAGEYQRSLVFNRLGMARDRVFEISWSTPTRTALNGAFLDMTPHSS